MVGCDLTGLVLNAGLSSTGLGLTMSCLRFLRSFDAVTGRLLVEVLLLNAVFLGIGRRDLCLFMLSTLSIAEGDEDDVLLKLRLVEADAGCFFCRGMFLILKNEGLLDRVGSV